MTCTSCGHANRAARRFCAECGASLAVRCAACGAANQANDKFCGACGAALRGTGEGERAARADPSNAPDPRDYTPRHLAEKILTSRAALAGERKHVTVLFADVQGSMAMQEDLDPEEWHGIIDRFFAILTAGVHRFEGTVNQYTGDGIMALFGAPIAHEDHAQRACFAALHLQGDLRRYAEELKRTRGLSFAARLGLNSGEVVVGKIGDDLRMDYTAQGHVVGLAARMEQLAAPDRAYLTEHTAALVAGYFRLRDLGLFTLKGVREPLRVHELEGLGPLRTRLDVSRARGFSRFVGRTDEMAALAAALTRVAAGAAQVVGVVAEAGVGKSRLVHEFAEHCRAQGVAVHTAHGVAHGKLIPFLPVLELLRNYFGLTEQDGDAAARTKIAGTLVLLDPALGDSVALLFEFLGVPDPQQPAPPADSELRQRALLAIMKRLVHAGSQRAPQLILIEDLHWIDGGSEAFLESLVDSLQGSRTLLLVNFRPEYHAGWMQRSSYEQLSLAPFGAAASAALLDDLLGSHPSLAGLAELVHARTGGNPFFIEEAIQSLAGSGVLEGERGAYRLMRPVQDVAIPPTVQALLAARIDRVGAREKAVLETAAVIGKEFSAAILERVAALPAAEVDRALQVLAADELVYALASAGEYAFKHPLTQEVAYRMQLADRRARVHAAVARALADLSAGKGDERAALLAHHWEAAGEALEAARWTRRAAQWVSMSNFPEGLRHWQKVRALVDGLPESAETRDLASSASASIFGLQVRLGVVGEEPEALLAELQTQVDEHQEPRLRAILIAAPAAAGALAGKAEEAIEPLREATLLADSTADTGLQLALRAVLVLANFLTGRLRDGLAIAEEALAGASGDPRLGTDVFGFVPVVMLRMFRAILLRETGRLDEAARELHDTEALAEAHGQVEVVSMVHQSHVDLARLRGDARPAMAHARRAIEAAETLGSAFSRGQAYAALACAHALNEDWDAATAAYEQSLSIIRESGTGLTDEAFKILGLAETYLHQGRAEEARRSADEAIALSRRYHARVSECYAQLALARVLLGTAGAAATAEIEAALARALALVVETGAVSQEPFIRLECAELARLAGDDSTRAAELEIAHRLFVAMGAGGHAERVSTALSVMRQRRTAGD